MLTSFVYRCFEPADTVWQYGAARLGIVDFNLIYHFARKIFDAYLAERQDVDITEVLETGNDGDGSGVEQRGRIVAMPDLETFDTELFFDFARYADQENSTDTG